ncbi:MAG: hypothetical protein AAFU59_05750 [Pseudomonadota bacterium]
MRRALLVSTVAHVGLITAAVVSWDWGVEEPPELVEFAEVDVLTEDEFNAAISTAPKVEIAEPETLAGVDEVQRQVNEPGALTPVDIAEVDGPADPDAADANPDLSAIRERNTVTATIQTVEPQAQPQEQETALLTPTERTPTPRPTRPEPPRPEAPQRPSLNIDTTPAAPPPEDVKVAEEEQQEVAEAEGEVEEPVQEETAPEEAATEIIPEIAEDLPEDTAPAEEVAAAAPLTSVRPRARPAPPPEPEPQEVAEPEPAEETPSLNDLLAQVQGNSTPVASSLPEGPPITAGEREGLKKAVSQNWNVGNLSGYPSDVDLRLTVAFTLSREGQVEGDVRLLRPSSPDRYQQQAFATARRAILIASRNGQIRMPAEKYARWREVEITFDPRKQQVGF